jgi:hypothetical protein
VFFDVEIEVAFAGVGREQIEIQVLAHLGLINYLKGAMEEECAMRQNGHQRSHSRSSIWRSGWERLGAMVSGGVPGRVVGLDSSMVSYSLLESCFRGYFSFALKVLGSMLLRC